MSTLPKVCLIYTGGTIAMRKSPDGTLSPLQDPSDFLSMAPELGDIAEVDFVPLLNKDSTNITPNDWATIAHAVHSRWNKGYDGFVIAHGTDTMHFSASAVALALGTPPLPAPVVFTGSQTIPAVRHGDARVNLVRACKVATEDIAEVLIVFGEYIFRGCRAQKKDGRRFDAFESPSQPPLGYVTEHVLINPMAKRRAGNDSIPRTVEARFESGIMQVSLIPGLEAEWVELLITGLRPCRGLILQSFGAGNVPNQPPFALTGVIEKATSKGIPVIITSQFPAHSTIGSPYAPGKAAVEAGAIPTGNMTSACAGTKFRWVLAKARCEMDNRNDPSASLIDRVRDLMGQVFIEEMDR